MKLMRNYKSATVSVCCLADLAQFDATCPYVCWWRCHATCMNIGLIILGIPLSIAENGRSDKK
ncbi:hypothetical protein BofuT4_uP009090.1 [Botrytis cinerea T4]|uniref:Uncharacterized protein n=1 Tax=Botryotinia fuckeliana (strain T4) TaxID=999810 RepID=G2XXB4_BOTF4|nr:hypothetical protein BofuT4_uP009090.1 [Botrytis cinerea T4]